MHSTAKRQTGVDPLILGARHQLCTKLTVPMQGQGLCQLGRYPSRPAALAPLTLVDPVSMSRLQPRSISTIPEQAWLQVVWQLPQQLQEQALEGQHLDRVPPRMLKARASATRTGSG